MKDTYFFWLFVFCCIIFLAHLGYLYVDIMEARNFVTAREMVEDGNWIFTTMNGDPRYQKPPLPTWLSAGMGELFGVQTVWALRFPAGIACIALVLYFYKLLKKITQNAQLSFYAGLILATAYLVIFVGKRATWDIFSYAFALIGVYYVYKSLIAEKTQYFSYLLAGIFFGFSVLSKGPTGFYVIVGPFFLAYLIAYGFPNFKQWKGWILTGLVTAIVGFSWYYYIYLYDTETFLNIMEIESNARTNREVKSITRYFSFPIQMGIWAFFAVVSMIYPFVKKQTENPKVYKLLFWWTVICFVLLCLVPSKKERYLFPLMIPLAATTGIYVYHLLKSVDLKSWEKWIANLTFGLAGIIALVVPVGLFSVVKVEVGFFSITYSIFSFLIGIYLIRQTFFKKSFFNSFYGTVIYMTCTVLLATPIIDEIFRSNENHKSIMIIKEQNPLNLKIYSYNIYSPEIWFKLGMKLPNVDFSNPKTIPTEQTFFLVSEEWVGLDEWEKQNYKVVLVDRFDDNEEKEGTKNYVSRKKLNLYQVQKL